MRQMAGRGCERFIQEINEAGDLIVVWVYCAALHFTVSQPPHKLQLSAAL